MQLGMLICALYYWDIPFVVWERQKQVAKPFWNLLELETFLERIVLVSDWLHSDEWYLWWSLSNLLDMCSLSTFWFGLQDNV